ncbi:MAG: hypothetical protein CMA59_00170 [Euryarchaeota archaeon]|jgi:hypothetical protein|nr:hypothetical protein [Euryarchaeota archaeon]|tara:strand:- start:931 stop:1125 length:195 start_codon:yes stop_codon:yes gene_type:complete
MDWDLELKNQELQNMLTIYQDHIEEIEAVNEELKQEVIFLRQQLEYKTLGLPNDEETYSRHVQR